MSSVYFDPAAGGDGSTVTDDANAATGLANGGHRARFVPALAQTVAVAAAAVTAAGAAVAAAASAVSAPGTSATSTNNLTIALGAQSLVVQTGKLLTPGAWVVLADTAAPSTNSMTGQITSYDSGTGALEVWVSAIVGGGTHAAWTIGLSAKPGATGTDGALSPASHLYLSTNFGGY